MGCGFAGREVTDKRGELLRLLGGAIGIEFASKSDLEILSTDCAISWGHPHFHIGFLAPQEAFPWPKPRNKT
jgi:hypothetical protein